MPALAAAVPVCRGVPRGALVLAVVAGALLPALARAEEPDTASARYQGRTLGRLAFSGHRTTKDYVIARELELRPGQTVTAAAIDADGDRLENLSIFSSVRPVFTEGDSGLALEWKLKEMPPIIPFPAFSYNEVDGWSFGAGLASTNLAGRAISLGASYLPIGTRQGYGSFRYPWIRGNHLSLAAGYARLNRQDDLNEFREKSNEVSVTVGTYLGRFGRLSGSVGYFGIGSDSTGRTLSPDDHDDLARVQISLGYDSRDSYRRPEQGWQNEIEVVRTGGWLPGDGDFWTGTLDVRRFQRGFGHQVLGVGGLVSLQSGVVGRDIPGYLQYRMGGANSIRGYDAIELGRELYGKNQYIVTAEYSIPLRRLREHRVFKWTFSLGLDLVPFVDHGLAWSESRDLALRRSRSSLGAGLHLLVPGGGKVRFDFAWGENGNYAFHLAGGVKWDAQRARLR